MAVIREKTLKFPGLDNVYTFADEADLFDANVPCSAGEYRIYEGELYRCDADHTGAWNYAHFTPVKLGNEVSTAMAASVGNFAEKTIENVAIATFNDGAENVPVKSLVVNVVPVQSGSGDPSPDNVRPITGWTGANVNVVGKNLLPNVQASRGSGSIYIGQTDGTTFPLHLVANTAYTISATLNSGVAGPQVYIKENGGSSIKFADLVNGQGTYTPSSDMDVQMWVYAENLTSVTNFQLEVGTTATAYEPYTGKVIPITFPAEAGTVYGGTLENHGTDQWKLRVTHGFLTKNTANMNNNEDYPGWKASGIRALIGSDINGAIANSFTNISSISQQLVMANTNGTGDILVLKRATIDKSQTEWIALAMDIQFVIPLATPVEYTITAEAAKTILGLNNIWADTGDIDELIYRTMNNTDAKIRLTKALIAPVLDEMVADTLLAANDFRVVGDTLYIITGSVASGSALIPGTNCTATTIGEQITALLNA